VLGPGKDGLALKPRCRAAFWLHTGWAAFRLSAGFSAEEKQSHHILSPVTLGQNTGQYPVKSVGELFGKYI
jgi:hypothetical protein